MTAAVVLDPRPVAAPHVVWRPQPGSQTLFLTCPIWEVLNEGTRGSAKTDALLMDFAQHVGQGYGPYWRGILFRQSYPQLADIVARSRRWFHQIFPRARFTESGPNGYTWRFPDGEELLLRYMDNVRDYWNYHGHEYPWIGWEELTNWPDGGCYEAMKACNRSSRPGLPRKYRATANPYGVGHHWVKAYFIDAAPPGVVVVNAEGLQRVRLHSHWSENLALLAADPGYPDRLRADTDQARRRAWHGGDWDIVAGGVFDDLWDRTVHVVKPFPIPSSWRIDRSFDWGSSRPFSVGWWAESDGTQAPNGRHYPRGTLFRIAEWYGWNGRPNEGCRMVAVEIAKGIRQREQALGWTVQRGPADSSIFDTENGVCIADDMLKAGVSWDRADKSPGSRKNGWERLRKMLQAAREASKEEPGIYVFDTCVHFIRTVPVLPRHPTKPEDTDPQAEDHVADETRYRVLAPNREWRIGKLPL